MVLVILLVVMRWWWGYCWSYDRTAVDNYSVVVLMSKNIDAFVWEKASIRMNKRNF